MTSLIIETLRNELVQEVSFKLNRRYQIASIAPYLYMHNNPDGIFTLTLMKGEEVVHAFSFTSEDIKNGLNTPNNYAHLFFPLIPSTPLLLEKGNYKFILGANGLYHATSMGFLAWVKQHENLNNDVDYVLDGHSNLPLALRIKEYVEAGQ